MKMNIQQISGVNYSKNVWMIIFLPLLILNCNTRRPSSKVNDISQDSLISEKRGMDTASVAKIGVGRIERFGQYLTDADGRALYMFTGDTDTSSACYGNCVQEWPPLLTAGDPKAASPAVKQSLLGTIERRNGSLQVTYGGWPLYYYHEDENKGDLTGQDKNGFGGDWYLIAPDGNYIEQDSTGNPKARDA